MITHNSLKDFWCYWRQAYWPIISFWFERIIFLKYWCNIPIFQFIEKTTALQHLVEQPLQNFWTTSHASFQHFWRPVLERTCFFGIYGPWFFSMSDKDVSSNMNHEMLPSLLLISNILGWISHVNKTLSIGYLIPSGLSLRLFSLIPTISCGTKKFCLILRILLDLLKSSERVILLIIFL